MRYKYKGPLGCEREIEGEYEDIIDLMEYLRVDDIADRVTVNDQNNRKIGNVLADFFYICN